MSLALFLYADERCLRTLSCRPIAAWRSFGRRTVQGQAVECAHALSGSKPVRPGALDSLSLNGPIRAQRGPLRGVQSSSQRSSAYPKLQRPSAALRIHASARLNSHLPRTIFHSRIFHEFCGWHAGMLALNQGDAEKRTFQAPPV